jgi:hypothetical protein
MVLCFQIYYVSQLLYLKIFWTEALVFDINFYYNYGMANYTGCVDSTEMGVVLETSH